MSALALGMPNSMHEEIANEAIKRITASLLFNSLPHP
jgi:hypothetical protein